MEERSESKDQELQDLRKQLAVVIEQQQGFGMKFHIDMLHMFIDPQIRIDEARPLIKQITDSFPRDMSVIVSLNRVPSQYKILFPCFDRCIVDRSSDKPAVLMTKRGPHKIR